MVSAPTAGEKKYAFGEFASRISTAGPLTCDHLTLEAYEDDAYFKATDNAEVRTVG